MFLLTLKSVCLASEPFAHLHPNITTYFVTTKLHLTRSRPCEFIVPSNTSLRLFNRKCHGFFPLCFLYRKFILTGLLHWAAGGVRPLGFLNSMHGCIIASCFLYGIYN